MGGTKYIFQSSVSLGHLLSLWMVHRTAYYKYLSWPLYFNFTADFLDLTWPSHWVLIWVVLIPLLQFRLKCHHCSFRGIWFHIRQIYFSIRYNFLDEVSLDTFCDKRMNIFIVVMLHYMLCNHQIRIIKINLELLPSRVGRLVSWIKQLVNNGFHFN